ncbi:MAG: menaquinone biosynthetic enzyme MqnA/MqnD family protein [Deinococcales bacterium]
MTRLGIIQYTNVAPLLHTLESELAALETAWLRGVPTQINAALLGGEVDLANISAFEFLQHADQLRALPDFSIAVLGPVYSVSLFHTVPWQELYGCEIAVTTHSATSVKLLETLLLLDGIEANLVRVEDRLERLLERYPAALFIGDAALTAWYRLCGPISETVQMFRLPSVGRLSSGREVQVTDLAMSWYEHTAMPFVFAVWATHKDNPPPLELVLAMRRARRYGIGHLSEIAALEAARLGLPERIVQHYLWNFRYHLEAPDKAGLARFGTLALAQAGVPKYWDF